MAESLEVTTKVKQKPLLSNDLDSQAVWNEAMISSLDREAYLAGFHGDKEIKALFGEIDDARTDKDLTKLEILEVGCFNGVTMKILAQNYGLTKISGVDIDPSAMTLSGLHGQECVAFDIMQLEDDVMYDIIYMQHLTEDLDYLAQIIEKCLAHARKKVIVILNVFDEKDIEKMTRKIPSENHRYLKNITTYQLNHKNYSVWLLVFYNKKPREEK